MNREVAIIALVAGLMMLAQPAAAQSAKTAVPDLTGVYQSIPNSITLPGGLKNEGSPEDISLLPAAAAKARTADFGPDPAKTCQVIGPFRMMARDENMIDIVPSPRTNRTLIFFEDFFLGYMRQIFFDRRPAPKQKFAPEDPGQGDSFGHWEGDTLIVDTINFNQYIWLNSKWAPHSDALHLIEKYRLVGNGQYLEVKMTAEDPNVLTNPYTYTRYFQKVNTEIPQYFCTDDLVKPAIPNLK
jgi:hypothetical protein